MRKASILVAEDSADTLSLIQFLLEQEGYDVIPAHDGAAALRQLSESRPDVLITDLMMPEVSGLELIEYVRGSDELSDLPIIALSAFGVDLLYEAAKVGADSVVRKPKGLLDLGRTLNELME